MSQTPPYGPQNSSMQRFTNWLVEPSAPFPPGQHRSARLLATLLLGMIIIDVVYQIIYMWFNPEDSGMVEATVGFIVLVIAYIFYRQGYLKTAITITITLPYLGLLLIVITSAYPLEALNMMPFMVIPLLLGSAFLSSRSMGYVALFFSLGMISLIFLAPPITLGDLLSGELSFLWIVMGAIHLITRHRNAVELDRQAELANSEARFRMMFENNHAVMLLVEPDSGAIMNANTAAQEFYGYSIETLKQMAIQEINTLSHEEVAEQRKQALHEKRNYFIFPHRLASGEVRTVEVYSTPVIINGKPALSSIVHDITERKLVEETLQKSEAILKRVQGIAHMGSWEIDLTTKMVTASAESHHVYGIPEGSLTLAYVQSAPLPEFRPVLDAALTALITRGERYDVEFKIQRPSDGKIRDIHSIAEYNASRQTIFGSLQDITERKQAQENLRKSEERYRSLMEASDALIIMVDGNGRIEYVNDKAAQIQGMKASEVIGKNMHDLLLKPIVDNYSHWLQKVLSNNEGMVVETVIGQLWHRTSIQPVHDENGNAVMVLISAFDISELQTAQNDLLELNRTLEERVRQRTAEVQDLYDNSPAGYHSLDENGMIVMINQTELDWLGYTREELLGHSVSALMTEKSLADFHEIFPNFKRLGWVKNIELEFICKEGPILPVLLNATAVKDEAGKFLMSRSTLIDITQRKKAERALQESRDALSASNVSLEKAARMKDEFLASMSHELRTPLTGILGLSEALQLNTYGELNEKQHKVIKTVEDSGRHLLELINDILDLSKIEAGKLELQPEFCSLTDVCTASLQLIKGMAGQKHQHVQYSAPNEPIILHADARRLKQALVNLLSNAIKFTPENGELGLEVHADETERKVRIAVWDKGVGIKPEDMHKLFKPFTQIDSSLARKYAGTGLGLSLVQRLVELHKGDIEMESTFGEGSRFTITLPWSPQSSNPISDQTDNSRKFSSETVTEQSTLSLIVLVDDNQIVLELMADFLASIQYRTVMIHSGIELLEKVPTLHPDLILMDIQMPDMDGMETIRRIRAHPDPLVAAAPVIAVTALAMPNDRELCLRAGANDYMSKPLKLNELAATVRKLLERQ